MIFFFEQVILVGHSAGGLSVTWATHKFSNKIRLAVYVAATMLKLGCWTDQDIKDVKYFYFILINLLCFCSCVALTGYWLKIVRE